jgi:60s Acidic ribosomal protein
VKELLSNVGSGGGAPAVGAPAAVGGTSAAAAEAPAEEKKEEEKEESDEDMVSIPFHLLNDILTDFVMRRALVSSTDGVACCPVFICIRFSLHSSPNALYFSSCITRT